jgi:hypothetical protein
VPNDCGLLGIYYAVEMSVCCDSKTFTTKWTSSSTLDNPPSRAAFIALVSGPRGRRCRETGALGPGCSVTALT